MRYPVKKKLLIVVLVCLLVPSTLFSAAKEYKTGSMLFTFKGGTTLPTFIYFFHDNELTDYRFYYGMGSGDRSTKLYPGGNFSLSFEGFTTDSLSLGGELGYNFNYTIGDTLFSIVPLFFKVTYYPVQGKFDLPISLGAGISYMKFGEDQSLITLYANIDIGFVFYVTENWGIGIHSGFWLVPELNYTKTDRQYNSLLGMAPVVLSVSYRN
jgi:hypothetical protein